MPTTVPGNGGVRYRPRCLRAPPSVPIREHFYHRTRGSFATWQTALPTINLLILPPRLSFCVLELKNRLLMTIVATLVMQGTKRADPSAKQQLRLPTIAPKDDHSSTTSSSRSLNQSGGTSNVASRTRLPPRSRTGCWTCRTRKVKCGEERPACAQCTRLGHTCDYSPRLSFRDDTPRVVERMQDVSTLGSSVWDRKYLARASRHWQKLIKYQLPHQHRRTRALAPR